MDVNVHVKDFNFQNVNLFTKIMFSKISECLQMFGNFCILLLYQICNFNYMNCPNCNSCMIIVEREDIELNWCPSCHGFWFSLIELKLFAKKFNVQKNLLEFLKSIDFKTKEEKRHCPKCFNLMYKVDANGIVLDKCINNCGLWFDCNELSKFINSFSNDKLVNNFTINFLGEFFNIK